MQIDSNIGVENFCSRLLELCSLLCSWKIKNFVDITTSCLWLLAHCMIADFSLGQQKNNIASIIGLTKLRLPPRLILSTNFTTKSCSIHHSLIFQEALCFFQKQASSFSLTRICFLLCGSKLFEEEDDEFSSTSDRRITKRDSIFCGSGYNRIRCTFHSQP